MGEKIECRLRAAAVAMLTAIIVLTVSVAVPILYRPFYYAHINLLRIDTDICMTEEHVRITYNEVMDYCLGLTDVFELTYLPWSAEGASHFADVRMLFLLDIKIAAAAVIMLVAILAVGRFRNVSSAMVRGHTAGFWGAACLGIICILVSAFAALDFDTAFTVFHSIFFHGRDNWIFDPASDPVIIMLPQVFFRNCALLIAALIIISCIILILADICFRKNKKCHLLMCTPFTGQNQ